MCLFLEKLSFTFILEQHQIARSFQKFWNNDVCFLSCSGCIGVVPNPQASAKTTVSRLPSVWQDFVSSSFSCCCCRGKKRVLPGTWAWRLCSCLSWLYAILFTKPQLSFNFSVTFLFFFLHYVPFECLDNDYVRIKNSPWAVTAEEALQISSDSSGFILNSFFFFLRGKVVCCFGPFQDLSQNQNFLFSVHARHSMLVFGRLCLRSGPSEDSCSKYLWREVRRCGNKSAATVDLCRLQRPSESWHWTRGAPVAKAAPFLFMRRLFLGRSSSLPINLQITRVFRCLSPAWGSLFLFRHPTSLAGQIGCRCLTGPTVTGPITWLSVSPQIDRTI